MIKLRVLRWGDYTGLSGRPNVITRVLVKERWRVRKEFENTMLVTTKIEQEASHKSRNAGGF